MSKSMFVRIVPVVAVVTALGLVMLVGCSMKDEAVVDEPDSVVGEVIVDDTPMPGTEDSGKVLTVDEAKAIAFEDAGIDPATDEVDNVSVEQKVVDGVEVYEVEFEANGVSYDYVINAKTGSLIAFDEEVIIIENGSASSSDSKSSSSK